MATIVCVHGIAQEFHNEDVLLSRWAPAIRGSLKLVGYTDEVDLELAFYGDMYRRQGTMAVGLGPIDPADLTEYEGQLLIELWKSAARIDPSVVPPGAETMLYVPDTVRRAVNALSNVPFITGLAERTAILWFVNHVYRYFNEPDLRAATRKRVEDKIGPDTRIVVSHSLGTVVAYEAISAHPEWRVETLVTLGSPLGIRHLVFDRLEPPPASGVGAWPQCVSRWTNVSAGGDFVALERRLATLFGSRVLDLPVDNAYDAHDIGRYLTAREVATAIRDGLTAAPSATTVG